MNQGLFTKLIGIFDGKIGTTTKCRYSSKNPHRSVTYFLSTNYQYTTTEGHKIRRCFSVERVNKKIVCIVDGEQKEKPLEQAKNFLLELKNLDRENIYSLRLH